MVTIVIRRARPSDYHKIVALLDRERMFEERLTKTLFNKILKRNKGFCFVAERGPVILGTIFATHDGGLRGYVYKLAVTSEYRRKKIATMLMTRINDRFRHMRIPIVFAHVSKKNSAGTRMLESVGFRKRKGHFLMDIRH